MQSTHRLLCASIFAGLTAAGINSVIAADEVQQDIYASPDVWLCKPGAQDLCAGTVTSTTLLRDGSSSRESFKPEPAAPIDCFYVYPTISDDPAGNSGLVPGPGEKRAVEQQFAIFASVCKPFAPMYRQMTIAGLRSLMSGGSIPVDMAMGYLDVAAAWKHYLKYENKGRGVVLIGHSQGSRMLAELIKREIEGTSAQSQIVSAILAGFNAEVPIGLDVGGTFKNFPVCKTTKETGCLIGFTSYRANSPPPSNALFGRAKTLGTTIACVDPVAISGIELKNHIPRTLDLLGRPATQADWEQYTSKLDTTFVSLPGLLETRCVSEGGVSYLAYSNNSKPDDRRPADIPGDIIANGKILENWGWHVVDVGLPMGNLLEIVRQQAVAYGLKK